MKYFYDTEFLEGKQTKRFLGIPIGKTIPSIDLISIGIVAEDGREYYAISKDFNLDEAWNRYDEKIIPTYGDMRNHFPEGIKSKIYWIRENVLMPIFFELAMIEFHAIHFKDEWCYEQEIVTLEIFKKHPKWPTNKKWFSKLIEKYGKDRKQISDEVFRFISSDIVLYNEFGAYTRTKPELYGYYSAYDHVVFCWLFGLMKDLPNGFPMYTRDLKQMLDDVAANFSNKVCYESGNHTMWSLQETINHLKSQHNYPKETNAHIALADAQWNKKLYEFLQNI